MLIGPMISHSFWQNALLVGVRTSTMSFFTMKFCCGEYLLANPWNFIFRRCESCALVGALGLFWGHFRFGALMRGHDLERVGRPDTLVVSG
ncbi:unnamed protein product [Gulo gulo]|uniref:Uncharacterized protein n=1 Tax=Gulo gulo TaxID=48420 RepID=A0A9X9LHG5_GULGU|nr:unnamed protein product [Gulo gulo]